MKKLVTLLLFCLATLHISAIEKGNWGIRATFDVTIPGKWNIDDTHVKMFKPGCGFSIGGVYIQPIGKGFYFEPGLSFFYDTYSFDNLAIGADNLDKNTQDPSVRKAGLRLPLHFGYEFRFADNMKLAVYTGPELSYAISRKAHVKDIELYGDDFNTDLFGINEHRRFDCAWKVGIAVPVSYVWVGIDAAFGLVDLIPRNVSFRENRVSVTATYYF